MSKADPLKIATILDNNVRTLVESGVEKSKVLVEKLALNRLLKDEEE